MRDFAEMSYEAAQITEDEKEHRKLFADMFLTELNKLKGADIAPHLTCKLDVIKREYVIELIFPVSFDKFDSSESNIK